MREGAIFSGIVHAAVLAVLVFGLPSFVEPPSSSIVPVELIALQEELPTEKPEPKPAPETKAETPAPEPEPAPQEARAAPIPEPPRPEPEPEPEPEPPQAQPEPEPEPVPEPEPEAEPEPQAEPTPPKPRRRPEIEVAKPKEPAKEPKPEPKRDQLASILRNVEKLKEQPKAQPQPEETPKAPVEGPPQRRVSALEQNEMVRAIQQQLIRCWRLDPGALDAQDMVVEIRVLLNPDGSVQRAEIVDVVRLVQDGYFRSAAENAKRAIYRCSPFELPPKRYEVWRELTLRFNPREMFGT